MLYSTRALLPPNTGREASLLYPFIEFSPPPPPPSFFLSSHFLGKKGTEFERKKNHIKFLASRVFLRNCILHILRGQMRTKKMYPSIRRKAAWYRFDAEEEYKSLPASLSEKSLNVINGGYTFLFLVCKRNLAETQELCQNKDNFLILHKSYHTLNLKAVDVKKIFVY